MNGEPLEPKSPAGTPTESGCEKWTNPCLRDMNDPVICPVCDNDPCICEEEPIGFIRVKLSNNKEREIDATI